ESRKWVAQVAHNLGETGGWRFVANLARQLPRESISTEMPLSGPSLRKQTGSPRAPRAEPTESSIESEFGMLPPGETFTCYFLLYKGVVKCCVTNHA
ncbi:MAG TPA: hypothetical protein P5307_23150, partial [Pirellulaceae bacterium]|nr:hypothetical protein [Pirellulaceae bacterium]